MNKKFLSAILFGALTVASTGSFVSCKDYDDDIDNLQTQINGLASAKDLSDKVANLQSQIASAQSAAEAKAAAAQAVAEAAKAAAEKAGASAADVAKALDAAVAELEAKGATKEEVEAVKTAAAEAKAAAEAAATDAAAALEAAEAKLDAAVKAAEEKAEAAQAAADEAKAAVAALEAAGATKEDLKAVENAAAAAQAAADKAQAAADAAAADAAANKKALEEAATKSEADLAAALIKVDANTAAIAANVTAIEGLAERVKALEAAIPGLAGEESVKALASLATTLSDDVKKISEQLGIISKRLTSVVFAPTTYIHGIEAIKFVNLKYNDWGTDPAKWLANAADYKVNNNQVERQVADYGAKVEYMVSPDGVTMNGIKDLKFLLNDAKNTRAGIAKAANVELSFIEDPTIENGKLTGYVKKTFKDGKDELPTVTDNEDLIVASLKATIADDLKTAEEKDQEVAVYSDWTRVNEESGIPIIHKKGTNGDHFFGYSEIYFDGKFNQGDFRVEKEIIDGNDQKYGPEAVYYGIKEVSPGDWINILDFGITKSQVYFEPLDLMDLVTVCYGNNTIIEDYARYGFEFEFNLMDFIVRNQGSTKDNTNQKDFATLNGSILTSRAENGLTNNKNAIGHTPVIQAVLKDPKNNAVVDVRYFKIKWVEKNQETKPWTTPFEKVAPWKCSTPSGNEYLEDYKVYILEDEVNDFCSKIVEGGIKLEDFYNQYYSISNIYLGELTDEAKADILSQDAADGDITVGDNKYIAIGNAEWAYDGSHDVQTHNILLNYTYINPRQADFADDKNVADRNDIALPEQDFEKVGFFWFKSSNNTDRIFVPVKINVKKGYYADAVVKDPAQWNNAKDTRVMYPQLETDAVYGTSKHFVTTQMIGSLAEGYFKQYVTNGPWQTPFISELVNHMNYDDSFDKAAWSDIVFDESKMNTLPTVTKNKKVYSFHAQANGKKLMFGVWKSNNTFDTDYPVILAARIYGQNIYLADNARYNEAGEVISQATNTNGRTYPTYRPNEAALLLVGQNIPVKVTAQNCEVSDYEKFSVNFLAPLKFNGLDDEIKVYDIVPGGSKAKITLNTICLQECFGKTARKIYVVTPSKPEEPVAPQKSDYVKDGMSALELEAANALFTAAQKNFTDVVMPEYTRQYQAYLNAEKAYNENKELKDWYGIGAIDFTAALKLATTDLLTPGDFSTKLSDLKGKNGKIKYELTFDSNENKIIFASINGNGIQETINIRIPLSVDTKWQKATSLNGEIKVSIIPTAVPVQ